MRASLIPETDYETDLYAWTQHQAALLRARRADAIDWDNLAEEIESLGNRDWRELDSRIVVIVQHLLKWQFQPELRGASWRKTLRTQRREIEKLVKQSPSLRRQVSDMVSDAYRHARQNAVDETGLRPGAFPPTCPYTPEQVLDSEFVPDAPSGESL